MTVKEICDQLGLDTETAKLVMAQAKAEKAEALKQAGEFEALSQRATALEAELVADGKTGARNYKAWYDSNYPKIQKLQADFVKYQERYGSLEAPTTVPNTTTTDTRTFTTDDIKAAANELIQQQYAPQWSNLLKGSGKIIEKHLRAQRKNEIDWDKLSEIAATKGGDLTAAYDEWDKPERDKYDATAREAEIQRRVNDEMKKRNTQTFFPGNAEPSSGLSPLSKDRDSAPKYDRSKVIESAVTGEYQSTVH
jgi:hypothetical protein